MFEKTIRLVLSPNSWLGRKTRITIAKIKAHRSVNFSQSYYNKSRQNYYQHFVMKKCIDESQKVSIIVPCYNTPPKYFEPLLGTVFAQGYSNWELILIDASNDQKTSNYLKNKSIYDKRIKYLKTENEGIAANTNKGIKIASGEYIAFLDHDDTLDPNALAEVVDLFQKNERLGLVYTDEDKVSEDGSSFMQPHFKPDFSLDMLRNVNYITHFVVVRKKIARDLGGIRKGYEGAQDYDFLLRAVDLGIEVGHVPKVLYHWRVADTSTASDFNKKKHITVAGSKALLEHYHRRGLDSVKDVYPIKDRPGFYKPIFKKPKAKLNIYVNFSDNKFLEIEKNYVINSYKSNKDVKKYEINIIEGRPKSATVYDLIVNGAYIPAEKNTDIISLFMLCLDPEVKGVSPKIIRQGKIFDMGLVNTSNGLRPFMHNVNPNRFRHFGSLEWVRNVNGLNNNVTIENHNIKEGRYIIWSHSQFEAFSNVVGEKDYLSGQENYTNPNIVELVEIFEEYNDYLSDRIKIKE